MKGRNLGLDRPLLVLVGLLLTYGVLMIYSAGVTDVPTPASGAWEKQLVWIVVAACAGWATFSVSPRLLEWAAVPVYGLGLLVLLVTLAIGTGVGTAAGTKSWISIGGVSLGQPAEFAKLATILMLARWLSSQRDAPETLRELVPALLIVGVPALLVLKQPDLGSAIVFGGILFAMLYWAGVRVPLLVFLASPLVSLLLAFSVWSWGVWIVVLGLLLWWWRPFVLEGIVVGALNVLMGFIALPLWKSLHPYQQNRLLTFLRPTFDPRGANYQALQSKVAIGSGGWFGAGYLQGPEKRLVFLPAQHTDFIFAVVGEELGFFGVLVALLLFLGLLMVLVRIARRANEPFGSLVAFGIAGLLFTHIFENVGMTVNLMPITGIPLPFFSYGGSFLVATALAIGLALRIAWDSRLSGYADV
ncbi:MAG TPA: rod shape-determining protein RodA [Gemmatimonadales bacterium]|nr:rod shape-determining protein RodA [Gemmatimonadales bacterium]